MKCLSVHQPWAWLIIYGGKNIENRNWSTNYHGRLLIHATKKPTESKFLIDWQNAYDRKKVVEEENDYRMHIFFPVISQLKFGAIIGSVELVDVKPYVKGNPWADYHYTYKWVLENPHPITPIPYRGRQSLFDVDDDTLRIE